MDDVEVWLCVFKIKALLGSPCVISLWDFAASVRRDLIATVCVEPGNQSCLVIKERGM